MIVDQDQGRSIEIQSAPDDFARIDRHMIDGAHAKAFVGNEPVLAVQLQDVKPLDFTEHRQGSIVHHGLPRRKDRVAVDMAGQDFTGGEDRGLFPRGQLEATRAAV